MSQRTGKLLTSDMFSVIVTAVLMVHCHTVAFARVLLPNAEPEFDKVGNRDEAKWHNQETAGLLEVDAWQFKNGETNHVSHLDIAAKFLQLNEELTYLHSSHHIQFNLECVACRLAIKFLQEFMKHGASQEKIGQMITKLCHMFHIEKPDVCQGAVAQFKVMYDIPGNIMCLR